MNTPRIDLKELKKQKNENFKEWLKFNKKYVEWLKKLLTKNGVNNKRNLLIE